MRKVGLVSVSLFMLFVVMFGLSACAPEFMGYKEVVWYSVNPEIEIFVTEEKWREGTVNDGTDKIEVKMSWGQGGDFALNPTDIEVSNAETWLLYGEWVWDKRAKTLTITVIDDKIWNNDYPTIVLRYREVSE